MQGILAPLQFVVMIGSAVLAFYFLRTGELYGWTTASVVVKTLLLYSIMITGSLWEKDVFGQYLFAPLFFWEDVFSMGVMVLHTVYIVALLFGLMSKTGLVWLALIAYAVYTVNAIQFLLKLRAARREGRSEIDSDAASASAALKGGEA